MDPGNLVSGIIYFIFFMMTIGYFYLFWRDKTMKHVYFSLVPTFFFIYRLINHHHYQPEIITRRLMVWLLFSLAFFVCYWSFVTLWLPKRKKK